MTTPIIPKADEGPVGAGCEICQFTGKRLVAASPMFKQYGPDPCPCCYKAPSAPSPAVGGEVSLEEAEAAEVARDKSIDEQCRKPPKGVYDGRVAMRAALEAFVRGRGKS